jgi:anti-sigma factor RsiW
MHLTEKEIRAYIDQELDPGQFDLAQSHIDSCTQCQESAALMGEKINRIKNQMESLTNNAPGEPLSEQEALILVNTRIQNSNQEDNNMWKKLTSALPRPAWIAMAVFSLLVISMAFAPMRAIANSFLSLFRIEQVRVVEFNLEDRPEDLGASSQFEYMMSNQVQVDERGEPQEAADAAEASALAGFPVRLPSGMDGKYEVSPGGEITFNVDLEQVRTVLRDIGLTDIELPDSLDGAVISADIPSGVHASYGDCEFEELEDIDPDQHGPAEITENLNCTALIQMPNPVVEAPANLDIDKIGEAFLQVTGMSPEEASEFSSTVDWATTLVIPVPRYGTEHEQVPVDGVTGTFITHYEYDTGDMYLLIWIKNDIVYALSGPGEKADALEIVNSLQ